MPIGRDHLDQLRHLLRPIATRVANAIVRGVVNLADDSLKQQLLQLGALSGETIDGAENFQPYGLSSIPLAGAEHVTIFPNGDRSHPLTIAVSDRRYRPTGGQPGEVTLHNHVTARLVLKADGTVEIRSSSGTAIKLPTLADYNALRTAFNTHTHQYLPGPGSATPTGTATSVSDTIPVAAPTGTQVLKAQ